MFSEVNFADLREDELIEKIITLKDEERKIKDDLQECFNLRREYEKHLFYRRTEYRDGDRVIVELHIKGKPVTKECMLSLVDDGAIWRFNVYPIRVGGLVSHKYYCLSNLNQILRKVVS